MQPMCSLPSVVRELLPGFRDASSLAWRLAILSRNSQSANHDKVSAAWYAERKQQLERPLAATIQNGAYVTRAILGRRLCETGTYGLYSLSLAGNATLKMALERTA